MKIHSIIGQLLILLSLAGSAIFLPACQGVEPEGNPENCYFIINTTVLPGQDNDCPSGGSLGYDIHFRDETGAIITFNNLTVPNLYGYMLNLPGGHTYEAFVFNNGTQTGGCTTLNFDAEIVSPDPRETCARIRLQVDERPEIINYDQPDAIFSLPDICRGCARVSLPEPSCQSSADCEDSNDSIYGACIVPPNGYVSGSPNDPLDVDWYRLPVPPDHNCINLLFSPPPGSSTYRIALYQNGQLIAGPSPGSIFYCGQLNTTSSYQIKVYGVEGGYAPGACYSFQADTYNEYW